MMDIGKRTAVNNKGRLLRPLFILAEDGRNTAGAKTMFI